MSSRTLSSISLSHSSALSLSHHHLILFPLLSLLHSPHNLSKLHPRDRLLFGGRHFEERLADRGVVEMRHPAVGVVHYDDGAGGADRLQGEEGRDGGGDAAAGVADHGCFCFAVRLRFGWEVDRRGNVRWEMGRWKGRGKGRKKGRT